MGRKKIKTIVNTFQTNTVDAETGQIVDSMKTQEMAETWIKQREEPDYVKLYLDMVLTYGEVSITVTPLLRELLKSMNYADAPGGGQIIPLTKYQAQKLCEKLDVQPVTFRKQIKKLVDMKILKKIDAHTYEANPFLFGKGNWNDIRGLRANFDLENGFMVTETDHEYDESDESDDFPMPKPQDGMVEAPKTANKGRRTAQSKKPQDGMVEAPKTANRRRRTAQPQDGHRKTANQTAINEIILPDI